MKMLFPVILIIIVSVSAFAQAPYAISAWTEQTDVYPLAPGSSTIYLNPQMGGVAISGDYIYALGGNNAWDGDTARCFKMFVNKYTGAVSAAVEVTNFATADNYCYLHEVVDAYNGYLYVGGGGYNSTGPNRNDVTYVEQLPNGDLAAAWSNSAPFPGTTPNQYDPELGGLVITEAGYLYMFGGDGEDTLVFDKCYYGQLNPDGSIGAWQTGTTLPNTWWFPGVCAIGNDIIATGGILNDKSSANSTDKVYVCQTNSADGSMGAWVEQTEKLPEPIYNTSFVAVENTVFAIAGRIPGVGDSKDNVWRATYDPATHTVGAWSATTDVVLPGPVHYHQAVYSPESKRIYVASLRYRISGTSLYPNSVYISSPLFDPPVQTGVEKGWMLYE